MLIDLKNLLKNKFNQAKIAFTLKKNAWNPKYYTFE